MPYVTMEIAGEMELFLAPKWPRATHQHITPTPRAKHTANCELCVGLCQGTATCTLSRAREIIMWAASPLASHLLRTLRN